MLSCLKQRKYGDWLEKGNFKEALYFINKSSLFINA